MKKDIRIYLALLGALIITTNLQSQVTIGTTTKAAKAGILDLKTIEPTATGADLVTSDKNVTSKDGGLVLSRVKLNHIEKLTPFLTEAESQNKELRIKHAGLVVYNLNENIDTETDPLKVFKQGVYMWDGSRWSLLVREEFKFFYMPSFTLDISSVGGPYTVDLYAKYIAQFARKGASIPSTYPTMIKNPGARNEFVPNFKKNELDYYITYYDNTLLKDVSISDDGIMTYSVGPTPNFNPYAFLSIVFVVK